MILFHASIKNYNIGDLLKANEETPYFLSKKAQGTDWVDLLLNDNKPKIAPMRQFTLYACDSIGNASAYILNQIKPGENPNYYKVEMQNPIKGIMCLTDQLRKNGRDHKSNTEIANEYWKPTQNWKYIEYLSNEMKILEAIPAPSSIEISAGKNAYFLDLELRKKLYDQV